MSMVLTPLKFAIYRGFCAKITDKAYYWDAKRPKF